MNVVITIEVKDAFNMKVVMDYLLNTTDKGFNYKK